jgi:arylsulfatase B
MGHFEPDYDANNPILRDSQPVLETQYLTDAFTREACDFVRRHAGQPFFLYLAYNAVHSPLQALDADLERFTHIADIQRRIFAAMTANLDDNLGEVHQVLVQSGLERNTLVVFLSDNGGATRELTSSNAPLRGEKGTLYEGGMRVPFVIKWPDRIPAGTTVAHPISSLDLVPTMLAAANALPPAYDLHGQNLLPLLSDGQMLPARDLFWRMGTRAAMRHGDWKIVRHGRPGMVEGWQLFNLADDVSESDDLAGTLPDRVNDLETR